MTEMSRREAPAPPASTWSDRRARRGAEGTTPPSAGHLIRRLNQIAVALFLKETKGSGLTNMQYAALHAIAQAPAIDQVRLGRRIALDKATLAGVLDRLTEKGLITRTRAAEDRRSNRLAATPRGHALLARLAPRLACCETRILAPLAVSDRRRFLALLEHLVRVNTPYSRAPSEDRPAENRPAARRCLRRANSGARP